MKLKHLLATVAVLALLSAAAYWLGRPPAAVSQDPRVGQSLVESSAVEKAAKLRLTDAGKSVVLTRRSDGTWLDTSYFDLPADFSKLSSFVSDLTSAKLQRLVTTNPQRLARLEFKDSKIELLDASDQVLWAVTLGKNADSGGRFVRFDGESKAYLANLNAWLDSDPKSWANANLLTFKADDISKVDVGFEVGEPAKADDAKNSPILQNLDRLKKYGHAAAHETVIVSRGKKDEPWVAKIPRSGQRINAEKISSLLTSFGGLRFSDTSDLSDPQAAAAKAHARTFKFTTFGGITTTVVMGRKPEEKKLKPPVAKPAASTAAPATPAGSSPATPTASPPPAETSTTTTANTAGSSPATSATAETSSAAPAPGASLPASASPGNKPAAAPAANANNSASESSKTGPASSANKAASKAPAKPPEPEYETVPAGPVFVWVSSSDANAPINALMKKRAFQIDEYTFTSLPQKPEELFEPAPPAQKKPAGK